MERHTAAGSPMSGGKSSDQQGPTRSVEEIQTWMVSQVAAELGMDPREIDVRKPLTRYGLDSMTGVVLSGELEVWLGRPLPPGLLADYASIDALARHLTLEPQSPVSPEVEEKLEELPGETEVAIPARLHRTAFQRVFQNMIFWMVRLLTRVRVEGQEKIPKSGPLVLATNHLHIIDTPVVFSVLPRGTVFFVSDHMQRVPFADWFLGRLGQVIYVTRGKADRAPILRALDVLRGGGTLAIAPEGKISRTGGLLQGHTGVAYIATRAAAPVLPVVAYGQEKAAQCWKRLRRVPVDIRVGSPLELPSGKATTRELQAYTEKIMIAMATMLPPNYRGVYAPAVDNEATGLAENPAAPGGKGARSE